MLCPLVDYKSFSVISDPNSQQSWSQFSPRWMPRIFNLLIWYSCWNLELNFVSSIFQILQREFLKNGRFQAECPTINIRFGVCFLCNEQESRVYPSALKLRVIIALVFGNCKLTKRTKLIMVSLILVEAMKMS